MIKGECFTNLDNYTCSDINIFASVPLKGDYVYCKYKGNSTRLKVASIQHTQKGTRENPYPYIIVELNN